MKPIKKAYLQVLAKRLDYPSAEKYLRWECIKGDFMVAADPHIPFHSALWCARLLIVARKNGVKKLAILGDFFQFNLFGRKGVNGKVESIKDIKRAGRKIMSELLAWFDEIVIIKGNHDAWIEKFTEDKFNFEDVFDMFGITEEIFEKKIKLSHYPYMVLNDSWRLTHAMNYSVTKGNVANAMATKYRMNIINAHGHFFSVGFDKSGKNLVIDAGGLFDREKMAYIMLTDSTHPVWNNGFIMIKDNLPTFFVDGITDWKRELK